MVTILPILINTDGSQEKMKAYGSRDNKYPIP